MAPSGMITVYNYKLLPALASLLETQSVTESADNLNVTQSAMSKTLKHIRDTFHDPILVREGNTYILTRRGVQLKQQLPDLLQQLDALYLPQAFVLAHSQRQFSLSYSAFVSPTMIPHLCKKIATLAPQAGINCTLWQNQPLDSLAKQPFDLVATTALSVPDNLHGKKITDDNYVVVCCHTQSITQQTMTIDHYTSAKHILVNGIVDPRREVDSALSQQYKTRDVFAIVPDFEMAFATLQHTPAIATVPLHIAAQYAEQYQLNLFPLPFHLPPHSYYLLWHSKHVHDPEHQWFRELCFDYLKEDLVHRQIQGEELLTHKARRKK